MLCGALKQADRLRGTVVILVVVRGIGVQGVGRARTAVVIGMTVSRCIGPSGRVGVVVLAVRVGQILEKMVYSMGSRCSEKKNKTSDDREGASRTEVSGRSFHGAGSSSHDGIPGQSSERYTAMPGFDGRTIHLCPFPRRRNA